MRDVYISEATSTSDNGNGVVKMKTKCAKLPQSVCWFRIRIWMCVEAFALVPKWSISWQRNTSAEEWPNKEDFNEKVAHLNDILTFFSYFLIASHLFPYLWQPLKAISSKSVIDISVFVWICNLFRVCICVICGVCIRYLFIFIITTYCYWKYFWHNLLFCLKIA